MTKSLLAVVALVSGVVQAHAAHVARAIVVPLPVAIAILGLIFAVLAILLLIYGIVSLGRWVSEKRRAAAEKAAVLEQIKSSLKAIEQEYKPKLPLRITEGMSLTDVVADGMMVTYTYTLETSKSKLRSDFAEQMKAQIKPGLGTTVRHGAIHRFNYVDLQGKQLGTFDFTAADLA